LMLPNAMLAMSVQVTDAALMVLSKTGACHLRQTPAHGCWGSEN
jgi:hypothetical protein